ncbi:MAG: YkoF family thiamine/hydroxymethylpyrimidine-binding protein [Caldisericia bacterium]|nr:YkoF family thiamine/hydroxymethylpyrimidine-binding protein [Caldisericia bacterium]
MIQCQISLYPLANPDFIEVINECIKILDNENISYTVTRTNTLIKGETDAVFEATKKIFIKAKELNPENILIATYSSACSE